MKLHHLRNATFIIETEDQVILVDPMLGEKGTQAAFAFIRFKARKNPLVNLPDNASTILDSVTHCVITHKHPDHIDEEGERFLKENNIPVTCSSKDEIHFKKKGMNISQTLEYWKKANFLGGKITGIPARHGYGFIAGPMGNVMGLFIELVDQPSIYISADTIYTKDVEKVLIELKPQVAVVASGSAQLDIGKPLLMTVGDIVKFVKNAPGKVYANHLEALNHCPATRTDLKTRIENEGLSNKVFIPIDGETMEIN